MLMTYGALSHEKGATSMGMQSGNPRFFHFPLEGVGKLPFSYHPGEAAGAIRKSPLHVPRAGGALSPWLDSTMALLDPPGFGGFFVL